MASKKINSSKSQLVELISKQLGITKKSASAKISRVASGKSDAKKATANLSKYAKTKFNKEVKKTKAVKAAKQAEKEAPKLVEKQLAEKWQDRVNYSASERYTVTVEAEFDFYGSDKRKRAIRFDLYGDEINKFMNAPNAQAAVNTLKSSNAGGFLEDATVRDFERFEIHGKSYDEEFFD